MLKVLQKKNRFANLGMTGNWSLLGCTDFWNDMIVIVEKKLYTSTKDVLRKWECPFIVQYYGF